MIGRIMAIDYGSKRIGIAFSDPLRMFAKAHSVIANADLNILVPRLKQLAKQQDARLIVLGMPYAIDGSDTPKTLETKAFMKNLQELLDIR